MRGEAEGPEAPTGSCSSVLYHLLHRSKALIPQLRCKPWSGAGLSLKCQVKTELFWEGSPLNRRCLVPHFIKNIALKQTRRRRLLLLLPPLSPKGELLQKERLNDLSQVTVEVCGRTGNCRGSPGCPPSTLSTNSTFFSTAPGQRPGQAASVLEQPVSAWHWAAEQKNTCCQ